MKAIISISFKIPHTSAPTGSILNIGTNFFYKTNLFEYTTLKQSVDDS